LRNTVTKAQILLCVCSRVDVTTALEFVESCLNIPQLWQGRDTKSARGIETSFYTDHTEGDILSLSTEQLGCLVMYILMEAEREAVKYDGNYLQYYNIILK
jgi:hypothetical protein